MTIFLGKTRLISAIAVIAMFMTVFAIPLLADDGVYAATKANAANNKIYTPNKFVAGQSIAFESAGDRQTALNQTAVDNGDQFYLPAAWAVYKPNKADPYKQGLVLTDAVTDEIINNNTVPAKFSTKIKIPKPGKYKLYVGYGLLTWNSSINNFNTVTQADIDFKVKTITVYGTAKFNANIKKATLKTNSKLVKNGSKYGKLPKPSKKGKKFLGWYTKKKGGTKVTASTKVNMSKASTTLYAHWN